MYSFTTKTETIGKEVERPKCVCFYFYLKTASSNSGKFEVDSVMKNLQSNLLCCLVHHFKSEEAVKMQIVLIHISIHIALACVLLLKIPKLEKFVRNF